MSLERSRTQLVLNDVTPLLHRLNLIGFGRVRKMAREVIEEEMLFPVLPVARL